jgi:hypothetical protein
MAAIAAFCRPGRHPGRSSEPYGINSINRIDPSFSASPNSRPADDRCIFVCTGKSLPVGDRKPLRRGADTDYPSYLRQALFPSLVNRPAERYVELAKGCHKIIMEKNRQKLFEELQVFLDEADRSYWTAGSVQVCCQG